MGLNIITEKILVLPSNNNLNLNLASHDKSLLNIRIMTPVELGKYALIKEGIICGKEFISKAEELIYYKDIIEQISYFKTSKLSDIKALNKVIDTLRYLVVGDEDKEIENHLKVGAFKQKNEALFKAYKLYVDKLNQNNQIDTVGLIRFAIKSTKESSLEVLTLKEYELKPLEKELLNCFSNVKEISIFDLYGVEQNKLHIDGYLNCYGSSNEAETIIDDIFKNKEADKCVIACADYASYVQLFYDLASKYNLPVTFGEGVPLINFYPGKLLYQYYLWSSVSDYGWEPFNELIHCPYFNFALFDSLVTTDNEQKFNRPEFYKCLSKLRLTNNLDINIERLNNFKKSISRNDVNDNDKLDKYLPGFELLAKELALPTEEFISKYVVLRTEDNNYSTNFDEISLSTLIREIKEVKKINLELSDDILNSLLNKKIARKNEEPGKAHITSISGALTSLRDNLYVCGLSSSVYPGSPKEDPLLLDSDLKDFENDTLTSSGLINNKKESLFNLLHLASGLNNNIVLTYPGLNVSELKNNNASSLLFEIYKEENGNDKSLDDFKSQIKNVAYFDANLSKTKLIGEAYNNSSQIIYKALASKNEEKVCLDIGKYSPSALNTFFNCRKQFFYQNLLRINVKDDYDPYEVIPANEQGTLAHALMEYLGTHNLDKDEFIKLAGDVFDEYTCITVPLIKEKIKDVKEQFVEMLANGWQMNHDYPGTLAIAEQDQVAIHDPTGIKIHGFPDRVQIDSNGKAVVIDFKTERDLNAHLKDDVDTCLQVLIYAYIVEKTTNYKVDHCEYRMLRYEKGVVTCKYDEQMKDALSLKLAEFKQALDSGDFSIEPFDAETEKKKCKYCKYSEICGKVVIDE